MNEKALICGDRNWTDRDSIRLWIAKLQDMGYNTIIEGESRGADTIASEEAKLAGMNVLRFPAKWSEYGKAAGPVRNRQMLSEGKPNLVVAFHNNIENSKGTKNMCEQAKAKGIEVILVTSKEK